ncbi:hypothetical protein T492DRAFT_889824 [Pavlovales sp. CCMP2436]|nr:hypothetical protein T492DRAFT_889824 [Pavlovales sp. CCMP2436]
MESLDFIVKPATEFARDSIRLIKRSLRVRVRSWRGVRRPLNLQAPQFTKVAIATSFGFAIMGFIGFFVKLIFIPINNIIVGLN